MTEEVKKKERIIDKVRKLMAKADPNRNASAEEAAVAAGMAQKLLEEHKLSMTDVEFAEMKEQEPIKQWFVDPNDLGIKRTQKRIRWSEDLAVAVARAHMCDVIVQHKSNGFTVVGRRADAEVAIFIYHYLYEVCTRMEVRAYRKEFTRCKNLGDVTQARGFREAYRIGFVNAVSQRYKEIREQREREMNQGKGVALVRLNQEEVAVKDFMQELRDSGATKSAKPVKYTASRDNSQGLAQGYEAGSKVDLNKQGVKAGRAKGQLEG